MLIFPKLSNLLAYPLLILIDLFFFVSNLQDKKGLIKSGNERVIEARLADAKFFWEKNKTQNLVKQISKLQNISFFNNSDKIATSLFKNYRNLYNFCKNYKKYICIKKSKR